MYLARSVYKGSRDVISEIDRFQILNIIHRHSIAKIIREDIDRLDESTTEEQESSRTSGVDNVLIGSPDSPITFDALEEVMSGDRAFANFRVRLQNALHRILPLFFGVESRPSRSLVAFSSGDKVGRLHHTPLVVN